MIRRSGLFRCLKPFLGAFNSEPLLIEEPFYLSEGFDYYRCIGDLLKPLSKSMMSISYGSKDSGGLIFYRLLVGIRTAEMFTTDLSP